MKKYCSGGYCKHADENGMVDTEYFTKSSSSPDGLQSMCTDCRQVHNIENHVKNNPLRKIFYKLAGGFSKYYALSEEDRRPIRSEAKRIHLLNTAPREALEDTPPVSTADTKYHITSDGKYYYEPKNLKPLRTVTTTVKPRNTSLVTYLKEKYNYTCQVRGCSEQEVDVAHLHPHRYKDSVDNETNATVLCKNHHWSLDHRRMYIEDDLSFTRYNLDGKMIEESIIECHEDHNIDAKFITKSQDWFLGGADDREEQAMG